MARVTHSTLTRRTQTLGDYSPAGLKYRKDESTNGEIRAKAERPTSFIQICRPSFIHVRESTPTKICRGRSNQGPASICQTHHFAWCELEHPGRREAAGRAGQRGGTASPRFHRLESPSSPDTHIMATILTLLWHNACSKENK